MDFEREKENRVVFLFPLKKDLQIVKCILLRVQLDKFWQSIQRSTHQVRITE